MSVRATLLALAVTLPVAAYSRADTPPKQINIAAGDLSQALLELSKRYAVDLVYRPDQVYGLRTQGAHGELTTEQAARELLKGTNLEVRQDESGAMYIVSPAAAPPPSDAKPAAAEKKSFWSRLRLTQLDTPGAAERRTSQGDLAVDDGARGAQTARVAELEEIVVTGTHIRSVASSASPSYSFGQEDFAEAGATSVQQMLRQLPQNFQGGSTDIGSVLSTTRNNGGGNLNLGSGINLRGLGNSSTLVLLNGHRLPAGGLGAYVDVSSIPLAALSRIDVVPDGSSAIYGSDAVGGVVNFVLRQDFSGVETSVRHGAVTDGNLRELDANMLFGRTWSTGAALVSLSYNDVDPLLASERDFASSFNRGGETHLTPDSRSRALLINGQQQITDGLELSATLYRTLRDVHSANFRAGTSSSPPTQVMTEGSSDGIGGTVSLDWKVANDWVLGVAQTTARNDADRDNLLFSATGTVITQVRAQHDISVTDIQAEGPIFSMPGGSARLAAGGEHRHEALDLIRRSTVSTRDEFSRDVNAAYLEAFLPFIGEANRTSWAKRLELTAAVRYEDYDDVGSTTNSKFGAVWSPTGGVSLRATYGTSFRAPYLNQFDSTNAVGVIYRSGFNPSQPVLAALVQAPDPNLGPEEATTWTAGFDLAPAALGGLKVTGTYFDIDYRDRISAAAFALAPFDDPSLASLISQPPDPAILAEVARIQAENPANYANYALPATMGQVQATFDGRIRNQAKTRVSGIDFTLNKAFQAAQGTLDLGANASYLIRFENQTLRGAPVVDVADTIFNPVDLRIRGLASWTRAGWVLSAIVNYADAYKDTQLRPVVTDIDSWTTVDLGAAYTFGPGRRLTEGLTVRLNAINAFDKDPPRVNDLFVVPGAGFGNPGFDPENANPIGRLVSFQLSKRW